MSGPLRLLACADLSTATSVEAALGESGVMRLIGRASTGGEMLAQFRAEAPDVVLIAGDIDGCHGVRVAGALARQRSVPTLLVVEPGAVQDAREELVRRGVVAKVIDRACLDAREGRDNVVRLTLQLLAAKQRLGLAPDGPGSAAVRAELSPLAHEAFELAVLLGSAGTPHLLPQLLGARKAPQLPLLVAVHHNPRLSDAFCQWVGELCGTPPHPFEVEPNAFGRPPMLRVAGATAHGDGHETLEPDLDHVVDRVCGGGGRAFIGVASGMGLVAIDALRRARTRGSTVAVLDPSICSQPGMPTAVIGAGLADHVVSFDEFAWLIAHVSTDATSTHASRVRLAAAM